MEWMNERKYLLKRRLRSLAGCICFLAILCTCFFRITYIFRNADDNRARIVGLRFEKNLDMIYVGGSVSFGDWEPMMAWHDFGMASYCLGTDAALAENVKAYVEYANGYGNTDFFVIDAYPFWQCATSNDNAEAPLRNGSDSMALTSPVRYRLLKDYFSYRKIPEKADPLSFYFDIAKYHTHTEQLGKASAWKLWKNEDVPIDKGGAMKGRIQVLKAPELVKNEVRRGLGGNGQTLLTELLEYGKQKNLRFLFVASPRVISQEEWEACNTIRDIVESYGQAFLNSNDYYEEMKLDFSEDFFDRVHINVAGANKYTAFLANYICENYQLSDHRGDVDYTDWDQAYESFAERKKEEMAVHKECLEAIACEDNLGEKMRSAETLSDWYRYASTEYFSLAVVSGDISGGPVELMDQQILQKLGLGKTYSRQISFVTGGNVDISNLDSGEEYLEKKTFGMGEFHCSASVQQGSCVINLGGRAWNASSKDITVLAVGYCGNVVQDFCTIHFGEDGQTVLIHNNLT